MPAGPNLPGDIDDVPGIGLITSAVSDNLGGAFGEQRTKSGESAEEHVDDEYDQPVAHGDATRAVDSEQEEPLKGLPRVADALSADGKRSR